MGQNQKNMNLEELRSALASTATRHAERMEKDNARLKAEIREKNREIGNLKNVCRTMFNRCIAQTGGYLCEYCGHRIMCEKERTADKPVRRAEVEQA